MQVLTKIKNPTIIYSTQEKQYEMQFDIFTILDQNDPRLVEDTLLT